jgi:hypothetical protein
MQRLISVRVSEPLQSRDSEATFLPAWSLHISLRGSSALGAFPKNWMGKEPRRELLCCTRSRICTSLRVRPSSGWHYKTVGKTIMVAVGYIFLKPPPSSTENQKAWSLQTRLSRSSFAYVFVGCKVSPSQRNGTMVHKGSSGLCPSRRENIKVSRNLWHPLDRYSRASQRQNIFTQPKPPAFCGETPQFIVQA